MFLMMQRDLYIEFSTTNNCSYAMVVGTALFNLSAAAGASVYPDRGSVVYRDTLIRSCLREAELNFVSSLVGFSVLTHHTNRV